MSALHPDSSEQQYVVVFLHVLRSSSCCSRNLGEVLSIEPGQSAIRSRPKESIRGLCDGIHLVVGQALFDGEIGAQIAACLRIKRQDLAHETHLQDEYTHHRSSKPGLFAHDLPAPIGSGTITRADSVWIVTYCGDLQRPRAQISPGAPSLLTGILSRAQSIPTLRDFSSGDDRTFARDCTDGAI